MSKRMAAGFVLLLVILVSGPVGQAQTNNQVDEIGIALRGVNLSAEEAQKLEEKLKTDPKDVESRIILLGYYFIKRFKLESARNARRPHVLWIIENRPESMIAGEAYSGFDSKIETEDYQEGKKLWFKQVEANGNNATVLGNASRYFLIFDKEIAEDFLKKAQALEPNNPKWLDELGRLHSLNAISKPTETKREQALEALKDMEAALNLVNSEEERFYMLSNIARTAFEAEEFEKARSYSIELLNQAPRYKDDWNYGNAIHHGNMILGRLALKSNDLAKAKEYLIEAGKTPGSPQLNSFGPGMALARELLEKGEKETVIEYFHLCAVFWKLPNNSLKSWEAEVKENKIPNFSMNSGY